MCLLLIQINIDMVPVGGEGCRFARVSGGVVGIVATCLFFCFLWKWGQRKQKNGSFLADAAPGRYLEPTIAVTRTETASKQHEHRDQDINAHLPTDQLNFFLCFKLSCGWMSMDVSFLGDFLVHSIYKSNYGPVKDFFIPCDFLECE